MNKVEAIQAKLNEARNGVAAALSMGTDTASLRTTVSNLERQLEQANQEQAAAAAAVLRDEQAHASKLAVAADDEAHADLSGRIGNAEVEGLALPEPERDPAIAAAAAQLASARDRLIRETQIYTSHLAEVNQLQTRLTTKQQSRTNILKRRMSGDERPTDPNDINLLAQDISGLQELVERARATAEEHRPDIANRMVQEAELALSRAKELVLLNVRKARLRALETALVDEHGQIVAAVTAMGGNPFSSIPMLRSTQRIVHRTSVWEDR